MLEDKKNGQKAKLIARNDAVCGVEQPLFTSKNIRISQPFEKCRCPKSIQEGVPKNVQVSPDLLSQIPIATNDKSADEFEHEALEQPESPYLLELSIGHDVEQNGDLYFSQILTNYYAKLEAQQTTESELADMLMNISSPEGIGIRNMDENMLMEKAESEQLVASMSDLEREDLKDSSNQEENYAASKNKKNKKKNNKKNKKANAAESNDANTTNKVNEPVAMKTQQREPKTISKQEFMAQKDGGGKSIGLMIYDSCGAAVQAVITANMQNYVVGELKYFTTVDVNDRTFRITIDFIKDYVDNLIFTKIVNDDARIARTNFGDIKIVGVDNVQSFDKMKQMAIAVYNDWFNPSRPIYNFKCLQVTMRLTDALNRRNVSKELEDILKQPATVQGNVSYWCWICDGFKLSIGYEKRKDYGEIGNTFLMQFKKELLR